jgi:hypothetical protein
MFFKKTLIIFKMLPSSCYVCDAKYVVKVIFGMEICIAQNAHRLMRSNDCIVIDFIAHFYYIMHVQIS